MAGWAPSFALLGAIATAPSAQACPRLSRVQVENGAAVRVVSLLVGPATGAAQRNEAPDGIAPGGRLVVGIGCRGMTVFHATFADGRVATHSLRGTDQTLRLH